MNGIPMNSNLLALLSQNTGQATPGAAATLPPYLLKMLSQQSGTGLGNDQRLAAAQNPQSLTQIGL